jgi:hypothetical protein
MTRAFHDPVHDSWLAMYRDRANNWRTALNAAGHPIHCETEALALSVATYRRLRLQPL